MGLGLSSTLILDINEVSTVASVYALSGYMTGPLNVSSPQYFQSSHKDANRTTLRSQSK
jgi:hypothetical protein